MAPKDQLELAAKAIAVAAPSFAALKQVIVFVQDRSLQKQKGGELKRLATSTERLAKFREIDEIPQLGALSEIYVTELTEAMEKSLMKLKSIREQETDREVRRTQTPRGWRKLFSLYKPEGFEGWLSQTAFYVFSSLAVLGVIGAVAMRVLIDEHEIFGSSFRIFLDSLLCFSIANYCRDVSWRLRLTGNAQRRGELPSHLNEDLSCAQKAFLLFGPGTVKWRMIQGLYFGLLLTSFTTPFNPLKNLDFGLILRLCLGLFCFLSAIIIRADVLRRRAVGADPFQEAVCANL